MLLEKAKNKFLDGGVILYGFWKWAMNSGFKNTPIKEFT
jgi:hypothetical protein